MQNHLVPMLVRMFRRIVFVHGRRRSTVRAAAAALIGGAGVALSSLPAAAAPLQALRSGYGYGYGYGYGAANNILGTALNAQTVVATVPAGALLAGAILWDRRSRRNLSEPRLES